VTIVKVRSPYSYLVDMGNGQVRYIHANKIRKFVARSHVCGVISDNDVEFGRVLQHVNNMYIEQPSQRVSAEKLLHLNDQQRQELLAVLDDHSVCFRDRSGLYTGAVHCIETTSRRPRSSRPRRCWITVCLRQSNRKRMWKYRSKL